MTTDLVRSLAASLVAAWLLTGCGAAGIPAEVGAELEDHVAAAREAASTGDADDAAQHLDDLRDRTSELRDAGEIAGERADEILAAADVVAQRLDLVSPVDDAPQAEPSDEDGKEDEGKDAEKGEGKDAEKDEEKDAEKDAERDDGKGDGEQGKDDD